MQSERDTWVHSALLALPAALPSSGKQTAREAKRCCCVSAQMHASDPAGVSPLPSTDAHVSALNDVAVPESVGASHARAVSRLQRHGVEKWKVLGGQTDGGVIGSGLTVPCSVPGCGTL